MIDDGNGQTFIYLFDQFYMSNDFPARPFHKVGNSKKKVARKRQRNARKINRGK